MKRTKQLLAILLICGILLQFIPLLASVSATPALGTPDPGLNFYPTASVTDGFNTGDIVVGGSFNGEGLWLTEIHNNDVDRTVVNDTRAASSYEPVHTYDFNIDLTDLMEFIEVVSTHDEDVKLNDLYEFYVGTRKLNITTMDGSSDVTIKRAQPTVIWNYRSDLGIPLPTEAEFREDMHVPDNALVLKIVGDGDLGSGSNYSIKNKQTGQTVSSFTTENNVTVADGLSVELQLPVQGCDMEIYRSKTLPSAGYVYAPQVRYLYTAQPIEGFNNGKRVYITEIRANDIDRSGTYGSNADLMECIEVFNNTDKAIDLNKDYKLVYAVKDGYRKILPLYNYGNSSNNYVGSSTGCTVPAGGTAVLWCFRRALDTGWTSFPTLSEFRSAYGISSSTPVYIFTNQNSLTNQGRGIELFTANGSGLGELVSSYYYNGTTDLSDNKSVHLALNPEGPEMLIHSANTASTMGTLDAAQKTYTVDYGDAVKMHVADGYSVPEYIMQGDTLRVNFYYDFNSRTPRTATECYYRLDGTGSWTKATAGGIRVPFLFEAIVPAYELFDHDYVEFYVINSNKLRDTILGIYKVPIRKLNEVEGIRTNISQGEEVRGTVSITANDGGTNSSTKIYIDGTQYSTTRMMEDGAYFSFRTDGIGGSSKSQITTTKNETIAHIGDFIFAIPDNQLVPIDNRYFTYNASTGKYQTTLRFWAGTNGIASEDYLLPSGGRDDYDVSELQLKLTNGKSYLPTSIGPSSYNGVDTSSHTNLSTALSASHWIGDSSATCPYMDVSFSIPASDTNAVGITLDTTKLSDGQHVLQVTDGSYTKSVTFIVDNTKPQLDLGIANGQSLTGMITIAPTITEANTVMGSEVLLDGEKIQTPYTVTAYDLGEGIHTLKATVTDMAGNTTTKSISFTVADLSMSLLDAGAVDITGTSAKLYLTAQSNSNGDATFYKAEKIDASQIQTQTVGGLVPYLSYTINVGTATAGDDIVVNWNGSASNAGGTRACNMFVRNVTNGRWDPVATADSTGSIVNASFSVENHVEDGKALVIVQCTEGSSMPDTDTVNDGITGNNKNWNGNSRPDDYDFAFAWISDTQAYVQRTNYHQGHHMKMCQWIVDNREEWKIEYVMHTGDLVDDPDALYMWEYADQACKIFEDAGMPYGVLAGNHDIYAMLDIRDEYYNHFGEDRYKDQWYYGGSFENNYGHYDLISQNGQDFIILYMGYDLYETEINWMNKILAQYSDRKAILCFHDYTHVYESQEGNLSYYGVLLRNQVVAKNPNVIAVLSGHYSGASYQTVRFDDNGDGSYDRTVYQICTDYQDLSAGGLQYIKFLYFDLDNDKIYVNSYSPYKNDFNYYDSSTAPDLYALAKSASNGKVNNGSTNIDASILTVDFTIKQHSITGNSFSAAVYTDEMIGTASFSGGYAELQAEGLPAETAQTWYAVIENADTGRLLTDTYEFTTGHDYVAVVTPPGCGTGGYTTYTCSGCGDTYVSDQTNALRHDYRSVVTSPTCTEQGYMTYTCIYCGSSYVGTYMAPTGHSYTDGVCTTCGEPDPDYTPGATVPTLTLKAPTVEFKDMITVNAMFEASNIEDVVEMGMITYTSKVSSWSVETAEHIIPGTTYDSTTSRYIATSQGIHAKYLGDTVYLAVYAKLSDGTYAYSKLAGYSPVQYATSKLSGTDAKLKQLVAAMLNYGAAAQTHFGHNTSALANSTLTAEQKALPEAYNSSMVSTVPSASASKQGIFANNSGFAKRYPSISFEGAFCINYFFTPNYAPDNGITLYYWNEADYNAASVLTTANASGSFKLEGSGTGEYSGDIVGISAKALSEAVYVAAAYKDSSGTVWTSGVLGYSIGSYCASQSTKGGTIADLAMATAVYGYHAKAYFG